MDNPNPPIDFTYGGYACPKCGQWITNGIGHICNPPYPSQYVVYQIDYSERFGKIIELLEKILERLEKLDGQTR